LKQSIKLNWNFLGGRGCKTKTFRWEREYGFFGNYTILAHRCVFMPLCCVFVVAVVFTSPLKQPNVSKDLLIAA